MVLDTSCVLETFFFFSLPYFFFIKKNHHLHIHVDMSLHSKQCWITDLLKHLLQVPMFTASGLRVRFLKVIFLDY